jgi:hypothetical protein
MKTTKYVALVWTMWLVVSSLILPPQAQAFVNYKLTKNIKPRCDWNMLPDSFYNVAFLKRYAKSEVHFLGWNTSEYKALNKLWTTESHWRSVAYNRQPVYGKHAGGIPQILGLSTKTPALEQIDRGLSYIKNRYGKPSVAWAFHRTHGWY